MLTQPTPTLPTLRTTLDVDAAERETLLAALEIAQALASGDADAARFLATVAYHAPTLAVRFDALADRVFALAAPLAARTAVLPATTHTQEVSAHATA